MTTSGTAISFRTAFPSSIHAIPALVGAVHQYAGSMSDDQNREIVMGLADQLIMDGLLNVTEEEVLHHYQFWGYNPLFTIPMCCCNAVWVELTQNHVDHLLNQFTPMASN
jgi:hypothetical protein